MSEYLRWTAKSIPNLIATILAQPISQLSLFHPGLSFQVSQMLSKMIPIPHDDEALTQNSTKETGGGLKMREPQNLDES